MQWNIFSRGDKEVNVAKQGENYFATVKVAGEQIMTIVQPPSTFDSQTGIDAGARSVYDAKGNLKAEKTVRPL